MSIALNESFNVTSSGTVLNPGVGGLSSTAPADWQMLLPPDPQLPTDDQLGTNIPIALGTLAFNLGANFPYSGPAFSDNASTYDFSALPETVTLSLRILVDAPSGRTLLDATVSATCQRGTASNFDQGRYFGLSTLTVDTLSSFGYVGPLDEYEHLSTGATFDTSFFIRSAYNPVTSVPYDNVTIAFNTAGLKVKIPYGSTVRFNLSVPYCTLSSPVTATLKHFGTPSIGLIGATQTSGMWKFPACSFGETLFTRTFGNGTYPSHEDLFIYDGKFDGTWTHYQQDATSLLSTRPTFKHTLRGSFLGPGAVRLFAMVNGAYGTSAIAFGSVALASRATNHLATEPSGLSVKLAGGPLDTGGSSPAPQTTFKGGYNLGFNAWNTQAGKVPGAVYVSGWGAFSAFYVVLRDHTGTGDALTVSGAPWKVYSMGWPPATTAGATTANYSLAYIADMWTDPNTLYMDAQGTPDGGAVSVACVSPR